MTTPLDSPDLWGHIKVAKEKYFATTRSDMPPHLSKASSTMEKPKQAQPDAKTRKPNSPAARSSGHSRTVRHSAALYIPPHRTRKLRQTEKNPTSQPTHITGLRGELSRRQNPSSPPSSPSPNSHNKHSSNPTTAPQPVQMSSTCSDEVIATGRKAVGHPKTPKAPTTHKGKENNMAEVNPEPISAGGGPVQQQESPAQTREEALAELKMLQEQIVTQAHLNRFKDISFDTANPQVLAYCRDGPGTDTTSPFYLAIAGRRVVRDQQSDASPNSMKPGYSGEATETEEAKYVAQWKRYIAGTPIYSIIENGQLRLQKEPTIEHRIVQAQMAHPGLQSPSANQASGGLEVRPENKWSDTFNADWEYRPRLCSSLEAFRDWFRRWLDTTIPICCFADIYHEAFFNGTAHPDGVRNFFIPNLDDHPTILDLDDEETRLHAHENAEGYCHNWKRYIQEQEKEAQLRLRINRHAYLQALNAPTLPSPNSPKANIYIRPVEMKDVAELLEIFNWFAENSPLSTDAKDLEAGDLRQRIDNCQEEKLPFIVAAERKTGTVREGLTEKILGYALAKDLVGNNTSGRYSAELNLFVRPGHMRKGIGRCLMDKLLEVCDPTYIPKLGYFFDCSYEDRSAYRSGGRRRMARLLFIISHRDNQRAEFKWMKDWLEEKYEFEEQGLLKGARVKFDHFLNVSYLVRNVGYHATSKFEY